MHVILVQPPVKDYAAIRAEDLKERHFRASSEPLGLEYLAGYLEANSTPDVEVEIVDFELRRSSFQEIRDFFSKTRPDLIGVSCSFAPATPYAIKTARIAKEQTDALCVMGGVQASFIAGEILDSEAADIVLLHEAEQSFADLVSRKRDGRPLDIAGSCRRSNSGLRIIPRSAAVIDPDSLPSPARHLIPVKSYLEKFGLLYVASSRGCPYSCIYCACSAFSGQRFRARSAVNVFQEIVALSSDYGVKHISFTDDLLTLNRERIRDLCTKLVDSAIGITWDCHARVDSVDKPLLELMRSAGCIKLKLGVESGTQSMLDLSRRQYTLDQVVATVSAAHKVGFSEVRNCFILGMPGETYESLQETIDFAFHLEPDSVEFLIAMPFPGTELRQSMEQLGMIIDSDWRALRHGRIAINPQFCSPAELISLQKKAYEDFYFRKSYVEKQLERGKDMKSIIRFLSSWWFEIQQIGRLDVEG